MSKALAGFVTPDLPGATMHCDEFDLEKLIKLSFLHCPTQSLLPNCRFPVLGEQPGRSWVTHILVPTGNWPRLQGQGNVISSFLLS